MERRVLIHAPRGRDAAVIDGLLKARELRTQVCLSAGQLLESLGEGAAAAVLTEESLQELSETSIHAWLTDQPSWSDFPFVILVSPASVGRSRRILELLQSLGNAFVLERPVHGETLVRAAEGAVRARRRQYATRTHLQQLEDARAEVEHLNTALEERIAMRTQELSSANNRLMSEIAEREKMQTALIQMQKLEAIGRLTGGIAHDFNNLLQVISMNLDILLRVAQEPKVVSTVQRTKASVRRGAKLTSQLLSFARTQSLNPRPTEIVHLIEGLRDLIEMSAGATIDVELQLPRDEVWAHLDANQLEMALLNLVVNSRDAMPNGGRITITVRDAEPAGGTDGAGFEILVADCGGGIPKHLQEKVFDPFFTTKPVGSGTGLGLSQVYGFVRQSHGDVELTSIESQGTTIRLRFPKAPPPTFAHPDSTEEANDHVPAPDHHILVVDDDADVRRVITESLRMLGYPVDEADGGEAALAALDRRRYHLLVVDYAMPEMNGAELIARARARDPEMRVILATGYADMKEVDRVVGTQSILIKPFDIGTLADAVRRISSVAAVG